MPERGRHDGERPDSAGAEQTGGEQARGEQAGGEQAGGDPNLRHLLTCAVRVERRVRRAVEARQVTDPHPDDAFRGLYLTEETIARLLDEGRTFPAPDETDTPDASDETWATDGPPSRLTMLEREFDLSPLDVEMLLIALLPDLDDRFEAFYGYLNDDVTRRRPTIGLALGLCGLSPADADARARLSPRAPLRAGGLLLVEEADRPFLGRALRVPDRVTAHILGDDSPDPRLTGLLAPWHAVPGVGDPGPLARTLGSGVRLAYLREEQGGAGTALAATALSLAGRGVLGLDLSRLAEDPTPVEAVRALVREGRLTGAGLVCAPLDALSRDHPQTLRLLTDTPLPTVLVGRAPWDAAWSTRPPLLLHAPRVEPAVRAALWRDAYAEPVPADLDVGVLLSPFLLTPDQIEGSARSAAQTARLDGGALGPDHIRRGARAQNAAGLDRLARRIEPSVTWNDLVLPRTPTLSSANSPPAPAIATRSSASGECARAAAAAVAYQPSSRATPAPARRCRPR